MLFNSYPFIFIFLPLTLLIFFIFAKFHNTKAASIFLTIASLAFYSYWDIRYLPLLLCSILFNFVIGSFVSKKHSKSLLFLGVVANLALLGYFKYTGFFISTINNIFGLSVLVPKIILPLGISFFTFTQTAFLVDAYRGETENYSFFNYSLFVTFFPHLIAGPILYHKDIIPQFSKLRNFVFSHKNMALGIAMFAIGLFKKVIIADTIAPWVNLVFSKPEAVSFIEAWIGAIGYTLQLYFDFSGYSEMALGLGLMFNIHLPVNFNSPYKSLSIIDFWRRWHITLSSFLKNYLYIPLGGNRHGEIKRMRNLFITMLLGGLWHGAGWTYIVWGGMHGMYLVVNHTWAKLHRKIPNAISWVLTFLSVVVGWVVFRAGTLHEAFAILQAMIGMKGVMLPYKIFNLFTPISKMPLFFPGQFKVLDANTKYLILLPILFIACIALPNPQQLLAKYFRPNLKWALAIGMILLICLINFTNVTEFLYFQF